MPDEVIKYFNGRKIIITGGNGFLANAIVELLKDADAMIYRLGRPNTNWIKYSGPSRCKLQDIEYDIVKIKEFEDYFTDADVVFHLAAQTSSAWADQHPIEDYQLNVFPMQEILEICRRKCRNARLIFAGTVTQYGIPLKLPVSEQHPDNPITVYDLHKMIAEDYLKYYTNMGYVQGVTLRLSNLYGPGPNSRNADRSIINRMMKKALDGETVTVYGSGEYIRDYLFITDAAKAFLYAAAKLNAINSRHFIIGSGTGTTIKDAFSLTVRVASEISGRISSIKMAEFPSNTSKIEFRNFIADSSLFSEFTGWIPSVGLEEGLKITGRSLFYQ